jgi:hypothetical protein
MDFIDGRTPWMGDQLCRKVATYALQQKHRRNADRHPCLEWVRTHNPRVGAKTFRALDRTATVISHYDLIMGVQRVR